MSPFRSLVCGLWLATSTFLCTSRAQSPNDGFAPYADSKISVVVAQLDGKILVGGEFTVLGPNGGAAVRHRHIGRLRADGTPDIDFVPDTDGTVNTIAVQLDGRILIGGAFTNVGGQIRNGIARLDPITGAPDSFDPNAIGSDGAGSVNSIVIQSDNSILVGGSFVSIGGKARSNIARLNPSTGLADSLNPNADSTVTSMAIQPDGKILVGGSFSSIGAQPRHLLARIDPATGLADPFDPNADGSAIYSIAVQNDGKILVGGSFAFIGQAVRSGIARLDSKSGLADLLFNPGAEDSTIRSIAIQSDGKILVAGSFDNIGGQPRNGLARLDPKTGLADSFEPQVDNAVNMIAVQPDGKVLTCGQFQSVNGLTRSHIARFELDGRLDQTIDPNLSAATTAVQADAKILISGDFFSIQGVPRNNIARLNTDGTLDMTFDPNSNYGGAAFTVQPDGKIIVSGNFTEIGGQPRISLARLDPITGQADSFNPVDPKYAYEAIVQAVAVQTDGKILVAGGFAIMGGAKRLALARLDPETGLADSWDPNPDSNVTCLAVQPDGKILVGGYFNNIGGQNRNYIARLDPVTGLADSFNPNADSDVFAITVQPDGKVLVGGFFGHIGGQNRNAMARLDGETGLADSFNPHPNNDVGTIELQGDGKILVGGSFSIIGGQARNYVARLDPVTGLADSFDPNTNGYLASLLFQSDGKILTSEFFLGGDRSFARLTNDTAALQELTVTRNDISWRRDGSSPQCSHVGFEYSVNNGDYVPLGNASFIGGKWTLRGLSLPTGHIKVRARGVYSSRSESITESIREVFLAPTTVANLSTRIAVGTDDNAMIGGFIISGTQPKTIVVRGIGPSLPVPDALADPMIEIHGPTGEVVGSNDDWRDANSIQQIIASGLAPTNDRESALWGVINPGAYTVVVRGKNNGTGVGLFEVYDMDQTVDSKLANISTRGYVSTGTDVLIGGAIIIGNQSTPVLVRAIGPSLTGIGLPNALPDPILELHDSSGAVIASNDNWRSDQEAEIIATGIPPSNDHESAILRDLAPGNYTAVVRGVNDTTGVAVVEAYELN